MGTRLVVTARSGGRHQRQVAVTVTDRGPARRLYHQGRLLDLSPAAFRALAPLEAGVIPVATIEEAH